MRRFVGTVVAAVMLASCGAGSDEDRDAGASTSTQPPATVPVASTTVPADGNAEDPTAERQLERDRSITVGGIGVENAAPVRSIVSLGVSAQRPSVEEATQAAAAAATAVIAAIEANGIPAEDIQSSELGIYPVRDQFNYQVIAGYEVHLGYNVTFTAVDQLGEVLSAAIAAGGDEVRAYSIRFEPDATALMDAARAAAWDDVQARARSTAEHAGVQLGQVIDVHEKVLVNTPQGSYAGGEGDTTSFDIPVAPGAAGVTVLLTVTYEIGENSV